MTIGIVRIFYKIGDLANLVKAAVNGTPDKTVRTADSFFLLLIDFLFVS